jgi:hypothetical protein
MSATAMSATATHTEAAPHGILALDTGSPHCFEDGFRLRKTQDASAARPRRFERPAAALQFCSLFGGGFIREPVSHGLNGSTTHGSHWRWPNFAWHQDVSCPTAW